MAFDFQVAGVHAAPGTTDGTATGTTAITDSASTGTVSSGAINLSSTSVAHWYPASLLAGTHSMVASYSGDPSFSPSSSAPFTFTIVKAAPNDMAVSSPQAIPLGGSTTLGMVVGITTGAPPPTGTVTFYSGSTVVGTGQLVSCSTFTTTVPYLCSLSYGGYSIANATVSNLPLGTTTFTASYGGDANFNPVTSSPFTVTVEHPAGLTAVANPPIINQLEWTDVTATVTGVAGVAAPTGNVFFDATWSNGSWTDGTSLVNGSAVFNFGGTFNPCLLYTSRCV